jgi:ABC-2 type transport system permease protein
MNWKNVLYLMRVDRKSGRLLRGIKPTKYKENSFFAYWPYWLAIGLGLAIGIFAGFLVSNLTNVMSLDEIQAYVARVFVTLPTIVLVYNAVLTLLQQVQRSGVKVQADTPYWLPITWQEHTLASVLASLMGIPLGSVLIIVAAILAFSVFTGLIVLAIVTSVAVFAAAFLASVITEILRVFQVRFVGAVYKSSGRAAIWVRFIGSLSFFIIFYAIYFSITSGGYQFLSTLTEAQSSIFYIPFVWLGLTLSNFFVTGGSILAGLAYLFMSIAFITAMYSVAVWLNRRFGLYEPPAIKIQKSGIYAPKTGFLGKLGFSNAESALISKDLKAFTRRRELITIFITPIVVVLVPLMQSFGAMGGGGVPSEISLFYVAMIYLFPVSLMVITLGSLIIGEEGQAIWRIYASPISPKNLVKSKYFFTVMFGLIMLIVTGVLGTIIYRPSITVMTVAFLEGLFLAMALSAISVNIGFRGADFTEIPRPRMVRQYWALINMAVCLLVGVVILAPLIPTVLSSVIGAFGISFPSLNPFVATAISGVIAVIITVVFYKFTLDGAKDFLQKAEI